jgi:hypothetical protein
MSAISTTGARIVPSDNARPARPRYGLIEVLKLEGSPRYLYSEASITFISKPHYNASVRILAPYNQRLAQATQERTGRAKPRSS